MGLPLLPPTVERYNTRLWTVLECKDRCCFNMNTYQSFYFRPELYLVRIRKLDLDARSLQENASAATPSLMQLRETQICFLVFSLFYCPPYFACCRCG